MQAGFIIGAGGLIARGETNFDYNERSSVRDLIPRTGMESIATWHFYAD